MDPIQKVSEIIAAGHFKFGLLVCEVDEKATKAKLNMRSTPVMVVGTHGGRTIKAPVEQCKPVNITPAEPEVEPPVVAAVDDEPTAEQPTEAPVEPQPKKTSKTKPKKS